MSDFIGSTIDLADRFARQKYVILRQCLTDPQLSLLYRYACKRATSDSMTHDSQVPEALSAYGDLFMDGLLQDTQPLVEQVTATKLFPTYSYFRVYRRGDALSKHTDRPSCEISLTLCLGYQAERPWPIFIETPEGVSSSVELYPGDGLLYRGIECPHWREPLSGEMAIQVFLHYVNQDGPMADWKSDKRASLSSQRPDEPFQSGSG
jgi:hypothetical protein